MYIPLVVVGFLAGVAVSMGGIILLAVYWDKQRKNKQSK